MSLKCNAIADKKILISLLIFKKKYIREKQVTSYDISCQDMGIILILDYKFGP